MNVFDVVAEILRKEGVQYLFNFPNTPLIDACAARGTRPIVARQERVGVGMADGFSRVTDGDRIGVFAMQAGPGAENAFPGVACAYADSTPILVLPLGQALDIAQVRPYFNAFGSYGSITKSVEVITTPSVTVDVMRRAFAGLRAGRRGPVLVEIPRDAGAWDLDFDPADYAVVSGSRADGAESAISAAAEALVSAKSPVIYAGQGVLYARATEELRALAELVGAPVVTSLGGMSAFRGDHPLALGMASITVGDPAVEFVSQADLVCAVGASLTPGDLAIRLPERCSIVHLTDDPDDLNRSYFTEFPVLGDAKLVLPRLLEACADLIGPEARDRGPVEEAIAASRTRWLNAWMPKLTSDEVPITPYRVMWDFMTTVDPDEAIVTHDCGSPRNQFTPFYRSGGPHSYIGWGKSHALGTGLGLILGAKLAAPEKFCVYLMGDSAFGMTGLDLETAVRAQIPILAIVLNNSHMASETKNLVVSHEKYGIRDLGGDYTAIARGLGLTAERVTEPAEIVPALERARASTAAGEATLIEVITSRETALSNYQAMS